MQGPGPARHNNRMWLVALVRFPEYINSTCRCKTGDRNQVKGNFFPYINSRCSIEYGKINQPIMKKMLIFGFLFDFINISGNDFNNLWICGELLDLFW